MSHKINQRRLTFAIFMILIFSILGFSMITFHPELQHDRLNLKNSAYTIKKKQSESYLTIYGNNIFYLDMVQSINGERNWTLDYFDPLDRQSVSNPNSYPITNRNGSAQILAIVKDRVYIGWDLIITNQNETQIFGIPYVVDSYSFQGKMQQSISFPIQLNETTDSLPGNFILYDASASLIVENNVFYLLVNVHNGLYNDNTIIHFHSYIYTFSSTSHKYAQIFNYNYDSSPTSLVYDKMYKSGDRLLLNIIYPLVNGTTIDTYSVTIIGINYLHEANYSNSTLDLIYGKAGSVMTIAIPNLLNPNGVQTISLIITELHSNTSITIDTGISHVASFHWELISDLLVFYGTGINTTQGAQGLSKYIGSVQFQNGKFTSQKYTLPKTQEFDLVNIDSLIEISSKIVMSGVNDINGSIIIIFDHDVLSGFILKGLTPLSQFTLVTGILIVLDVSIEYLFFRQIQNSDEYQYPLPEN